MKKILLVLAASAFVMSCSKLAENEFELKGEIDPSLNGKSVYLSKMGGYMGMVPVDTVKIEDGKFVFKGTAVDPSIHMISIEGKPTDAMRLIVEHGEIEVEVDKDSLFKSKIGGTYNNDKLYEYAQMAREMQKNQKKKDEAFQAKYKADIEKATATQDTAAFNKLRKIYMAENKELKDKPLKFIKDNPKAYINIFLLQNLVGTKSVTIAEARDIFNGLDAEVKKTKEGKELLDAINNEGKPAPAKAEDKDAQADNSSAAVGKPAPAFAAPTPDGKNFSLKQAMGKVTVIDFWASWCKPCRAENPNVVAMYNELHPKGLNIISVSLDKDAKSWKEAIAADKLTWNHVSNLKFWEEPIAAMYGVRSIPATFVLDSKGTIVAKDLRGDALKAKVQELLNAK